MKQKRTKQIAPLIVEPHSAEYKGYPFITLIQYNQEHILCLIDNYYGNTISAYVLDYCQPGNVNEEQLIGIAEYWFNTHIDDYPLSIEYSKRGLTSQLCSIYRTFNVEHVMRVIGPLPSYDMGRNVIVKKKQRKAPPNNVNVTQLIRKS